MTAPICGRDGCGRKTHDPSLRCWQHQSDSRGTPGTARVDSTPPSSAAGSLGFTYGGVDLSDIPRHGTERALWRYRRALPEFVWDAAKLEGNTFTFPEVQTLLDGTTVGGRPVHDEQQVLGLGESARLLAETVESDTFVLTKQMSDDLHLPVARHEALEAGHFRGEGDVVTDVHVSLGELGSHTPARTVPGGANLIDIHRAGVAILSEAEPVERALAYNLFACLQQFYYDGNKRTARLVMNGVLMSEGYDAISVPARLRLEYNSAMVRFYHTKDGSEMMALYRDIVLGVV